MANRAYLLLNWSGDPSEDFDDDIVAAGASYFYPILWCSIFSLRDLMTTVRPLDPENEDDTITYLSLHAPLYVARERAIQRKTQLLDWFPRTIEPFYQQWLDLLAGIDAPFIQLDTGEIWSMSNDERSERELRTYIRAFEEDQQNDWLALLEQAQIKVDTDTKQVIFNAEDEEERYEMGYRLRGYGWMREVPWDDD